MVYERRNESLSRLHLLDPLMYLIQDRESLDRVVLTGRNESLNSRVDSLVPLLHRNSQNHSDHDESKALTGYCLG